MGTSCEQNLDISRCITGYSGLHSLEKWLHGTHHLQKHPSALMISLQHSWKHLPRLQTSQRRHPLVTIRSSDGDVSWGNPCLHHHAHWRVVKQCISLLHLEAGGAILAQRCREDADLSVILPHPGHLFDGSPQKTPGSTTIVIMPRWGEILDTTNHDGCSYRHSSCTPKQRTRWCNTINRGASISNCWRHRGGENWK